jgi:hypothetical protein
MKRLRRVLGPVAAAWLIFQVASLTFAPVEALTRAGGAALLECSCSHSDHGMCPMHHPASPRANDCLMKSAHDSGAAIFSMFLGPVGLVPGPTPEVVPATSTPLTSAGVQRFSPRPGPPDPPPPRA